MIGTTTQPRAAPAAPTRAERALARALPSPADVLFVSCLVGVVFGLQGRALGLDGDIGWHLRLGLRTLAGDLPRTDTFSATAFGRPLVGMEWLAEVCYAAVWRVGGLDAVVALAGLLIAGTAAALYLALRARGTPLPLALALALLGIALTSIHWIARPHLFSFPLTLWWSEWLWRYWRDGRRWRLWLFPPAMALWVNLHGGFLAGLILLSTALAVALLFPRRRARAEPRALAVTLGLCLAATAATPWGLAWPAYFASYFADPLVSAYTQELQSPDFHTLVARLFLLLLLLLAAAWIYGGRLAAARARPDGAAGAVDGSAVDGAPEPLACATAAVWTVLACTAVRAVPLWALVVLPLVGEATTRWGRELVAARPSGLPPWALAALAWSRDRSMRMEAVERQAGRGLWMAVATAGVAVVVAGGGRLPGQRSAVLDVEFPASAFPVAAVARLRAEGLPAGRAFNTAEWGGYLIYALPGDRVFIDSRSDFYGEPLLRDYLTVLDVAPGWQAVLRRYGVRWALVPAASPLASVLALSPGWSCHAMDEAGVAALCVRTAPPTAGSP